MTRKSDKVTFKPYQMNQPARLPPSLDEFIPQGHLVRVVNDAVERMNLNPLLKRDKGGGKSVTTRRTPSTATGILKS